jgi:uncharacterized membrane protein
MSNIPIAVPSGTVPATRPATRPSGGRETWTGVVLGAALLSMGLMAGLFYAFSVSVMPGLADADDASFVTAMQNINAAIENVAFAAAFGGAFLFTAVAAVMLLALGRRSAAAWTAAALVLYIAVLGLTMGVEVPLNDALAAAGKPGEIRDLSRVREDFEPVWVTVNMVRTLLCTLAFACLGPALVQFGRGAAQAQPQPQAQPQAQPQRY